MRLKVRSSKYRLYRLINKSQINNILKMYKDDIAFHFCSKYAAIEKCSCTFRLAGAENKFYFRLKKKVTFFCKHDTKKEPFLRKKQKTFFALKKKPFFF